MSVFQTYPGMPGLTTEVLARHRQLGGNGVLSYAPGGGRIDVTKTRDPFSTTDVTRLQAGLLMGRITSGGKWANSCLGTVGTAYAAGTSITLTTATITELVRRVGATGTFKITGPPTAGGVVRTLTATYSATSGAGATITTLLANQVERINFNIAATGGNLQLRVQKPDGTFATTGNAAWSATDATFLTNINSALDTATGVTGGIVATAISATDTDLGIVLTYSGTGYAGLPWTRAEVAVLPTSTTFVSYTPVTTAVDSRFVAGSLVQPTDGSETVLSFLPPGWDVPLPSALTGEIPFTHIPDGGEIDTTLLLPSVSDASLKTYLRTALNVFGKFRFVDGLQS